jgi:thiol-disulfide isomerase/thioredoxin
MSARKTILLPGLLLASLAFAQNAPQRRLEVQIAGVAKDTIYLANYYGNKLYYADTAVADTKGNVVFNSAKGYPAGVYAVVAPGPKYFEVILNEPVVKLATDKSDLLKHLQVKQSKENELFIGYIRFLNDRKLDGDALKAQLESTADPIAKANIKARMSELDTAVRAYQTRLVEENPNTLAAALVRMSMPVDLPEPRKPDGTLDSAAAYYQYRAHFWDNFDLTDDRIVRVPVFANKFDEYISKVVPQVPDTINKLADALIAKSGQSPEVFKYMVHNITHRYETSDIMGMDAVLVHMAQTYYCPKPGQASRTPWMSDENLQKLCDKARKLSPLLIGKPAPYLCLTDTSEQKWTNFRDLPAEYVVIVFWDPHCGHCKKELPEIHKVYKEQMKDLGIEVFTVAKAVDESLMRDWKKFIRENKLDWVNVGLTKSVYEGAKKNPYDYIPKLTTLESLNYADTYDVFSTPKLFVVDGERKFIGKQLSAEQIVDLVKKLKEAKAK